LWCILFVAELSLVLVAAHGVVVVGGLKARRLAELVDMLGGTVVDT